MLSLLFSNVQPLLELFLGESRSWNSYAPLKTFFLFFSIYAIIMEDVTWYFFRSEHQLSKHPRPPLHFPISPLILTSSIKSQTKLRKIKSSSLNLLMRISDCFQCNNIFSPYVKSPILENSCKITLRNTWKNIPIRNLVFSWKEIKNIVLLKINYLSFQFPRHISQFSLTSLPLSFSPPALTPPLIPPLKRIRKCASQEVIFVFFDANWSTFLISEPLKCFKTLKSLRQHWQLKS